MLKASAQVRFRYLNLQGMRYPARVPHSWPHSVPWFPHCVRPCSPVFLYDWEEQRCRFCRSSQIDSRWLCTDGSFQWRYTLYFGHFASELSLLFSPSPSSPEYQGYSILSLVFPTRLAFQHIRLLHQVGSLIIPHLSVLSAYPSYQVFMFFSIAVSRVAPVLFPDAADDASSPVLAHGAVAILEKIKNADRERESLPHVLFPFLNTLPLVHSMIESQVILPVKPPGSKGAGDPDEHSLALLTREMENLVIENRLAATPASSDLGRARDIVIKRVKAKAKAQVQERPGPRRRAFSQRSIGTIQLPSPVSPAPRPFGSSTGVEVIDVDALPDAECRAKQELNEQGKLRSEVGPALATYLRARSKSY